MSNWSIAFLVCYAVTMVTCSYSPSSFGTRKHPIPPQKKLYPPPRHFMPDSEDTSGDNEESSADSYSQRKCFIEIETVVKHEGTCIKLGGYWPACRAGVMVSPFTTDCGSLTGRHNDRLIMRNQQREQDQVDL
ncbi:uncharacterized protein LOC144435312 [Glandiceps talaboti]